MAHGNELLQKRYFYLKLPKNWFKNARIKKLRRIAGGDTYTIIYLKMLLMAMNHESTIIYEGVEPTIEEELALKLDEETENVKVTINFLKMNELWEEKTNGDVHLIECDSMVGSETYGNILKKEQKKRIGLENFQPSSNQSLTKCQPNSNYKDKELEIDKELELEKDIEKESNKNKSKQIETNRSDLQSQGVRPSLGYGLAKVLSNAGYIDESEIVIDQYDELLNSWLADEGKTVKDLRTKIGYFLKCASRRSFSSNDNKYCYFKTAMESSFERPDSEETFSKMMDELKEAGSYESEAIEDD